MKQINSILIANRGEIASRIIRTCKKMGISSIAVYSDADRNALYVKQADKAVFIGESNPALSYLDMGKIIQVAQSVKADAIHPGYGFLSENADFAKSCATTGIIFIGPNPEAIQAMGSKSEAKGLMEEHGVPTVPGYIGKDQSSTRLISEALKMDFPVLLKATAGGGGKGMRIVHKEADLESAIESAKRESLSSFGNDELIVEKYISSGRHIEIQIFGDQHGNAIHLLERECSIQRRYQKVIEESPSPVLTEALRKQMGESAVMAAKALNYDNAGTVEFIFDEKTGNYYFLEVNTRLQVEHPVTEEITGLDLVQMQIESAQGLALKIKQKNVRGCGYAIEARLYAEDAENDFTPVTGKILKFEYPEMDGLRIESAIESGSEISVFYDPMIAKIIIREENRQQAHRKLNYFLKNLVCLGTKTNQDFLLHLTEQADFINGNYDTHFIKDKINLKNIAAKTEEELFTACIAACLVDWNKRENSRGLLKSVPSGWRSSFYDYQKETYLHNDKELVLQYRYQDDLFYFKNGEELLSVSLIQVEGDEISFETKGLRWQFTVLKSGMDFYLHNADIGNLKIEQKERFPKKKKEKVKGGYEAPMPSQILKIMVKPNQEVKSGEALIVISSMKMENTIYAEEDGLIEEVYAKEGDNVEAGFLLMKLKSKEAIL